MVEPFAFVCWGRVDELLTFELLFEILLFVFQGLDFCFVGLLEFLEGVGREALSFEFLYDLIGIDNASDLFKTAEGIFIIVELLFLIVLVMFVGIGEGGGGFGIVKCLLFLFKIVLMGILKLLRHVFIDLLFLVVQVFMSHLLYSDSPLLESF